MDPDISRACHVPCEIESETLIASCIAWVIILVVVVVTVTVVGVVGVKVLVWVAGLSNTVGEVFVVDVWINMTLSDTEIVVAAGIMIALTFVVPPTKLLNVLFEVVPLADIGLEVLVDTSSNVFATPMAALESSVPTPS